MEVFLFITLTFQIAFTSAFIILFRIKNFLILHACKATIQLTPNFEILSHLIMLKIFIVYTNTEKFLFKKLVFQILFIFIRFVFALNNLQMKLQSIIVL